MGDKDRFVDELLDSAMTHHPAAEPRPGLEARILERVRAAAGERDARTKVWKLWIAAEATAAVVVMFVAIYVANRSHNPALQTSQTANAVPSTPPKETLTANSGTTPKAGAATPVVEPKRAARGERKSSRRVEAHHWPSQFPTPAPLTDEEKALIQYVRETPPKVLAASLFNEQSAYQPVEIEPLKIDPLEIQPLALGPAGKEIQ
jgi:hypothetical protein